MITEDKEGLIKVIIFYVITGRPINAANVKTEEGITSGSSLRDVVRIYGDPFQKSENDLLGYQDMKIYYRYGNDGLTFRFKNGVLESINLTAENI